MKIIVHIGFTKSGSTHLQNCLFANSRALLDKGIVYKTLYTNDNNELRKDNAYSLSSLQTYIKFAQAVGSDTLLLSSEGIPVSSILRNKLLSSHEIHLIGYVRFFTAHFESALAQSMKRWEKGLNKISLLSRYSMVKKMFCQQDNITSCSLFSYEKASQGGLAAHFFARLGIENFPIKFDMSPFANNVTPPTAYVLFLNFIKLLPTSIEENLLFRDYFLHLSQPRERRRYLLMHPEFYYQYARRHERDLDQLSQDIDYTDYTRDSLSWLEKQTLCPWKELPREQFYAIYETLPEHLQAIIQKYLPRGGDIYATIEKYKDKKIFPLYLTEADRKQYPDDFVPLRKLKKIALKHSFDNSLNRIPYFFYKILNNYANHYRNVVISKDKMQYFFRSYDATYKKMLCLEFARLLGNENMFPLLMCGQRVLPEMLENVKWYAHRKYILDNLQRTKDRPILVYGAGFLFNKYYPYFQHHHIHCILLDGEQLPKAIDGIPVAHPEDVLHSSSDMPIFIFIQQAPLIKQRIQQQFPQCTDIVTCCF